MKAVLLLKGRKSSPEGTLKKYPGGLVYKKQGDKWVYVGKDGSTKVEEAIREARQRGLQIISSSGGAPVVSTPQTPQAPVQSTSAPQAPSTPAPAAVTAQSVSASVPTAPVLIGPGDQVDFSKYAQQMISVYKDTYFQGIDPIEYFAGYTGGTFGGIRSLYELSNIISGSRKDPAPLRQFFDFMGNLLNPATANSLHLLQTFPQFYNNSKTTSRKVLSQIDELYSLMSQADDVLGDTSMQPVIGMPTPMDRPFFSVWLRDPLNRSKVFTLMSPWSEFDKFVGAISSAGRAGLKRAANKLPAYRAFKMVNDPTLSSAADELQSITGLDIATGQTNTGKTLKLSSQYIKLVSGVFKKLLPVLDMKNYIPPDGQKLRVRIQGTGKIGNMKVAGFYSETDKTINIAPTFPGTIVHELGHYFWYRDQNLQNDFMNWARRSGFYKKIEDYIDTPQKLTGAAWQNAVDLAFSSRMSQLLNGYLSHPAIVDGIKQSNRNPEAVKKAVWFMSNFVRLQMHSEKKVQGVHGEGLLRTWGKMTSASRSALIDGIVKEHPSLDDGNVQAVKDAVDSLVTWNTTSHMNTIPTKIDNAITEASANATASGNGPGESDRKSYKKNRNYWLKPTEMFARAFQSYLWKKGTGEALPKTTREMLSRARAKGMTDLERDSEYGYGFPEVDVDDDLYNFNNGELGAIIRGAIGSKVVKSMAVMVFKLRQLQKAQAEQVRSRVRRYLKDVPSPTAEQVKKLAKSLRINRRRLEEILTDMTHNSLKVALFVKADPSGAERQGHKYLRRYWQDNKWNYVYEEGTGRAPGKGDDETEKKASSGVEEKDSGKSADKTEEKGKPSEHWEDKLHGDFNAELKAAGIDAQPGVIAELGDRSRTFATDDPQKTALDPINPYDGIQLARPTLTKRSGNNYLSKDLGAHLRPHQADFVNQAWEQFEAGGKTMLNMDGTGAGKTRQQLGLAKLYLEKKPDSVIMIYTENKRIIKNAFTKDGKAMGVDFKVAEKAADITGPGIYISTYSAMKNLKDKFDDCDFAMFDECHNMKNQQAAKTKLGKQLLRKAYNVAMFSATPMDKPEHLGYLCEAFGLSFERTMGFLGYKKEQKGAASVWGTNIKKAEVADRVNAIFEALTEAGVAVKREVQMTNLHAQITNIPMGDDYKARWDAALEDFHDRVDAAEGKSKGLVKATGLMGLRRLAEETKVKPTIDLIKKELSEGRKAVLFATRVNQSEIEGDTEQYSTGTLLEMKKQLEAQGIKCSAVFGGEKDAEKQIKDFQDGDVNVILTTPQSGGTGLSLDDTTGKKPRTAIVMTPPFSANDVIQMFGRVNRLTTKTLAKAHILVSDNEIDEWNKDIIANKLNTLGATVKGAYAALSVEDLERVSTMTESDAKAYLQDKINKVTVGVGSKKKFDLSMHVMSNSDVARQKMKEARKIVKAAPAVTKFDNMTITKQGDKFFVRTDTYNPDIVKALQGIPQSDRYYDKTISQWIVRGLHYDKLKAIGEKHATFDKAKQQAVQQQKAAAPSSIGGIAPGQGGISATIAGDRYYIQTRIAGNQFMNVLAEIKQIPGRHFNDQTKMWDVGTEHHALIQAIVNKYAPHVGQKASPAHGQPATPQAQAPQQTPTLAQKVAQQKAPVVPVHSSANPSRSISPQARLAAHDAVKMLAQFCDGASSKDNAGFAKYDVDRGHALAQKATLSDAEFHLARLFVQKYHRQLPVDIVKTVTQGYLLSSATPPQASAPQQAAPMTPPPAQKALDDRVGFFRGRMAIILKAKPYPVGTVRPHKGGKYKKVTDEQWERTRNGKTTSETGVEELANKEKKGKKPEEEVRKIKATPEMYDALKKVSESKVYMDDMAPDEKKVFNVLTKEKLIEWTHVGADEYVAKLTEHGQAQLDAGHAHVRKNERLEENDQKKKVDTLKKWASGKSKKGLRDHLMLKDGVKSKDKMSADHHEKVVKPAKEHAEAMDSHVKKHPMYKLYRGSDNEKWGDADPGDIIPVGMASFSKTPETAVKVAGKYLLVLDSAKGIDGVDVDGEMGGEGDEVAVRAKAIQVKSVRQGQVNGSTYNIVTVEPVTKMPRKKDDSREKLLNELSDDLDANMREKEDAEEK